MPPPPFSNTVAPPSHTPTQPTRVLGSPIMCPHTEFQNAIAGTANLILLMADGHKTES